VKINGVTDSSLFASVLIVF